MSGLARTEMDVAAPVVAWLKNRAWDVYQEVSLGYASRRIDIVATRGALIWAIEVKQSLSLALLDQAWSLVNMAHYVSVATPRIYRGRHGLRYVDEIVRIKGLGRISVDGESVFERVAPELHRRVLAHRIRDRLCEEQREGFASAGSQGGYFTPFMGTRRVLLAFVKANPGCTLKETVAAIEHHYATDKSALSSLYHLIGTVITEVRAERDGRRLRLYANEEVSHAS